MKTSIGAQMSYGYETDKGTPGNLYDLSPYEIVSRAIEDEDGKVRFGMGVVAGTSETQVKLPSGAGDVFEGVVLERAHEEDRNGDVTLGQAEEFSVLRYGRVWVRVPDDCDAKKGDPVELITSGDDAGKFKKGESTDKAPKGCFISAAKNGLAPIALYVPIK